MNYKSSQATINPFIIRYQQIFSYLFLFVGVYLFFNMDNQTWEIIKSSVSDAYIGVTSFVAGTLLLFFTFEKYLKIDVKNIKLEDLRKNIAIVPQEAFLFTSSISENLRFGEPNASKGLVKKSATKAEMGHANKAGTSVKKKVVEFQGFEAEYKLGDTITVTHFEEGEFVDVTGTSKGKGFQGVVKRHGFAGVGQANAKAGICVHCHG